jgi:hypothetical protein
MDAEDAQADGLGVADADDAMGTAEADDKIDAAAADAE